MSSNPWAFRSSTVCSMIGLLPSGTMGFGTLAVNGRSRVPNPPAMRTAFMVIVSGRL